MKKWLKSKYPLVRQYDRIDCGPAALLSVLRYYGGDASLVSIRDWCRTDAHGSTMLDLVRAAKKLGFEAMGATGSYEALAQEKMPCIAHVVLKDGLHHFLVVYRIDDHRVYVGDPGRGRYWMQRPAFLDIWQNRTVILLTPGKPLLHQNAPHWIKWISAYLKKELPWIYQSLFLGIVYTLLGLVTALFVQWLIDRFIPEQNIEKILYTGAFLLFLLLIQAICGYLRERFLVILNKRVNINLTSDFLSHLFHLPKSFFDKRKTGDITARINDSIKIHQAIALMTNSAVIDGMVIIGSLSFMFIFAPLLALMALVLIPVYSVFLWLKTRQIQQQQNEVMKNHALVESTYIDSIRGIDNIIGFHAATAFIKLNQGVFKYFQAAIEKLGFTRAGVSFFALCCSSALSVLFLTVGATGVIRQSLLLGELMAAYSLLNNVIPSVNNLVGAHLGLQGAYIAANRLMDMVLVDRERDRGNKVLQTANHIRLTDLTFGYAKAPVLLHKINLELQNGTLTALCGPSGSGKSTLVHLLQKKYAPQKGDILIDNVPIERCTLNSLRHQIGVVPQTIHLFNGSLADNILMGRAISDIKVLQCAVERTGLGFLDRFEHGLYTRLGEEGRRLSGGETQMLGLLRAMLFEPAVLVIDEGFSSIDLKIENILLKSVQQYARNHMVLMITHDMGTLLKADYVYLLQQGRIVEQGKPARLIQNKTSHFFQQSRYRPLSKPFVDAKEGDLQCPQPLSRPESAG